MIEIQQNKPEICAVVAVGPDNVIGLNGTMPWHSRADFYHFKQLTMGNPVVFGKNTFFNLPKYPLPKRLNIVCSSAYKTENIGDYVRAASLEDAMKYCQNFKQLFFIHSHLFYSFIPFILFQFSNSFPVCAFLPFRISLLLKRIYLKLQTPLESCLMFLCRTFLSVWRLRRQR